MARNIVSTQVIEWVFDDKISDPLKRVEDNIKGVEEQAKKIKEQIEEPISTSNYEKATEKVDDFIKKMKSAPKSFTTKVKALVSEARKKVSKFKSILLGMPKSIKVGANFIAEKAISGIKNLKNHITSMPRRVLIGATALVMDAQNKIKGLWSRIKTLPKNIFIRIKSTGSNIATEKLNGFKNSVLSTATGIGVFSLALAGVHKVTGFFSDSINRIDTLNNFPKVIHAMGASTDDAKQSIDLLKEGIKGLPTTLDGIASVTQAFYPMSSSAKEASESALALNNAFLASGAKAEDASRGIEQYKQMLSSGKVDMMSFKTLQETMPYALREVAKSFGIVGDSAENDLYQKIQAGDITFKELNQRFVELNKGSNGFAKMAKTATGGWNTAFSILKSSVVRNFADIITSFDKLTVKITGESITSKISRTASSFDDYAQKIEKGINGSANTIKKFISFIKPALPLITSLGKGFLIAGLAVGGFKKAGQGLKDVLRIAGLTNPWVLFGTILISIGIYITKLMSKTKKGREQLKKISDFIKDTFNKVVSKSIEIFKKVVKVIEDIINPVKKGNKHVREFKNSWEAIGAIFKKVAKVIEDIINPVKKGNKNVREFKNSWEAIGAIFKKVAKVIEDIINPVKKSDKHVREFKNSWEAIGATFKKVISWSKDLIKNISAPFITVFNQVKKNLSENKDTINKFTKLVSKIVKDFVTILSKTISGIWEIISIVARKIKKWFNGDGKSFLKLVSNVITIFIRTIGVIIGGIVFVISTIMKVVKGVFSQNWGDIKKIIKNVIDIILNIIDVFSNLFQGKWSDLWQSIANLVQDIFGGVVNIIKGVINTITGLINGMIDGIDTVWEFFSGKKTPIHHIKKLANGGVVGDDSVIMVNDSPRQHWKELIEFPDGKIGMAKERNAILTAPIGTRVYSGEETHAILGKSNIEHFANGGIVGGIGRMFGGIGNWIKDKYEAVTGFLSEPLKHVIELIQRSIGGKLKGLKNITSFGKGLFNKIAHPISEWFKRELTKIKSSMGGSFDGKIGAMGVYSYLEDIFKDLKGKWGALQITSGQRDGDPYFHGKHMAMDVAGGGSGAYFTEIANYVFDKFKDSVAYVITNGQTRDRKGWTGTGIHDGWARWPDNDHYDHVHINGAWGKGYGTSGGHHSYNNNWEQAIKEAASAMKVQVTPADISNILSLIMHESSGNEKAIQNSGVWDINMANGNPAQGLLQFIPQTFMNYAVAGHTDILNGYDQLLAFFNRNSWRNFNPMGGWSPFGARRFAFGGHVTEPTLAIIGENNGQDEYVINPHQPNAKDMVSEVSRKIGYNGYEDNGEIVSILKNIVDVLRENKHVYLNIGGELVDVTDKMIGERTSNNNRWNLGGGAID